MAERLEDRDGRRRYRVLRLLGQGGFGTVYLAEVTAGQILRKVALKIASNTELKRDATASLQDEARTLAALNSSVIVKVESLVRLDGALTMVMEYVDGVSLRALCRRGPVPPRTSAEIVGQVAQALEAARHIQLIHRDIKPENVMLTANGDVKLLDFGLARARIVERASPTTIAGKLPFSPGYRAPERVAGQPFDAPADIYALGVLLFELLTGDPLGDPHGNARQHRVIIDSRLEPLDEQLGADSPLLALIRDMLAYDPDQRPAARAVARQCNNLAPALSGEPLFDWARDAVPTASRAAPVPTSDARVNQVYTEEVLEEAARPAPQGGAARLKELLRRLTTLLWHADSVAARWSKRAGVLLASATSLVATAQQLLGRVEPSKPDPDPQVCVPTQEICDGRDDDCDGLIDEQDPSLLASSRAVWYADADGDGLGDDLKTEARCAAPAGTVAKGGDCDDRSAAITRGPDGGCPPATPVEEPAPAKGTDEVETAPPPPAPSPAPSRRATQPPRTGTVRISGDPERVTLSGPGGRVTLGPGVEKALAAGSYTVTVTFESTGVKAWSGGTVEVMPGQTKTLTCRSDDTTCR